MVRKKDKPVVIRMTKIEKEKLKQAAKELGLTTTGYIEKAIKIMEKGIKIE